MPTMTDFPSVEVRDYRAGRVSIPSARLTFLGIDAPSLPGEERYSRGATGQPRATFVIPQETPATINGIPVHGRIALRYRSTFVRWLDSHMEKQERATKWDCDFSETSLYREHFASLTDGARKAVVEFAEKLADERASEWLLRVAESVRLAGIADSANGEAEELADKLREANLKARRLRKDALEFAQGAALYGVRDASGNEALRFVSPDRAACKEHADALYVHPYDRNDGRKPSVVELIPEASK